MTRRAGVRTCGGRLLQVALLWVVTQPFVACAEQAEPPAASTHAAAPSFHEWFDALRARVDRGDDSWEAVHRGHLEALPIVRIELKRSEIFTFTSIEVVFEGGDRATKSGGMDDWPSDTAETLVADVPFHVYARLCWLIESLDLPDASESWSVNVSHGEQRDVSWTTRDGRTVELKAYGESGPPAADALAWAIQDAARGLAWRHAGEGGGEDGEARDGEGAERADAAR